MIIDLHIHTKPRSPCSSIDPVELVREAVRVGLDGICLTEHQIIWGPHEVEELANESALRIFRGNEITTNQGDILVFGFDKDIQGVVTLEDLYADVKAAHGFMIAAHPFRGFKTFGISQLQMTVEQGCQRKVFQFVDALEIKNCRVTEDENEMAQKVAAQLGLPGVPGSDAHRLDEVGTWVALFEREIKDERELVQELRAGRFTISSAR